jgi:hypothetical protein
MRQAIQARQERRSMIWCILVAFILGLTLFTGCAAPGTISNNGNNNGVNNGNSTNSNNNDCSGAIVNVCNNSTGNNNSSGSNSSGSSLGGNPTGGGRLRIEPTQLSANSGSTTTNCTFWGTGFGAHSGWDCSVSLYNDTDADVNWYATVPSGSGVLVEPSSSGLVPAHSNWQPTIHVPLSAGCPTQIVITFAVNGGSSQAVTWNCSA